jgi:predicted secreted hydrolase
MLPAAVPTPSGYQPITFPRDEWPHDNLTEWWYYTGHLQAEDGRAYGFELVVFQSVRRNYPVQYLAQFAITDRARGVFQHDSRRSQGSQIGDGLSLTVQDWQLGGGPSAGSGQALGSHQVRASMDGYSLSVSLQALKPAVLHDVDGLVSFGAAGDSYYYSYTRVAAEGTLVDHGEPLAVVGQAWFDHQWGDFLVSGGGWDWFSAQLDDGSELMLNYLRDNRHRVVGVWGTYVDPAGSYRSLTREDFSIRSEATWTSPKTGGTYPMGWSVSLSEPAYELRFEPVMQDQELVSDGLIYWEGASEISGTRDGHPIRGRGYVELTGYAKRHS